MRGFAKSRVKKGKIRTPYFANSGLGLFFRFCTFRLITFRYRECPVRSSLFAITSDYLIPGNFRHGFWKRFGPWSAGPHFRPYPPRAVASSNAIISHSKTFTYITWKLDTEGELADAREGSTDTVLILFKFYRNRHVAAYEHIIWGI